MPFTSPRAGQQRSTRGKVQTNVDSNLVIERGVSLPWAASPAGSYVYYDCAIGVMLDSGLVVHNALPQVDREADTLATVAIDDPSLDKIIDKGINLSCRDQYTDIVQRMGHARYWFRIWGQALRLGYRVPIPSIKTVGGVPTIPYDRNPQWAVNALVPGGNYGGVPLWRAVWSLWYTTAVPPTGGHVPAVDPSAHITGDTPLPAATQAPWSAADSNATRADLGGDIIRLK